MVFSGYRRTAEAIAELCQESFGEERVATHLVSQSTEEQDEAVSRFFRLPGCSVLVCDASAEEGRNLQCATELIHLDLPLSVNRLEQRIGRADRYNEGTREAGGSPRLCSRTTVPPGVSGHLRLLVDGVGVSPTPSRLCNGRSPTTKSNYTSGCLKAAPMHSSSMSTRFTSGSRTNVCRSICSRNSSRRCQVGSFTPQSLADLVKLDTDSSQTTEAFDRMTSRSGGIEVRKVERLDRPGTFSYSLGATRSIPLMSKRHQDQLMPLLPGLKTFSREASLRSADAELLRLGQPLADWFERYLRVDEGGRTHAIWRTVPGFPEPQVWFCFDLLLEFDQRCLDEFDSKDCGRLRRHGDAFLPPRLERVWTNGEVEAPDRFVRSTLDSQPEAEHKDYYLFGEGWPRALRAFPDWSDRCRVAEATASRLASERAGVCDWRQAARSFCRCRTGTSGSDTQVVGRPPPRRSSTGQGSPGTSRRRTVARSRGRRTFSTPRTLVFAAGAVVLSGDPLDG